jgi:hypothetical protein
MDFFFLIVTYIFWQAMFQPYMYELTDQNLLAKNKSYDRIEKSIKTTRQN